MKKIQVTTIPKQTNIQVIELDTSFVVRVAKLQVKLETLVEASKHIKREYNEETGKHEEVHDDNGRKVYEYHDIDGNFVAGEVFQFFNELVKAFEE